MLGTCLLVQHTLQCLLCMSSHTRLITRASHPSRLSLAQGGVGWSLMLGTGAVVARTSDGWSPPSALGLCGFGWGLQAGGVLCDVLIVLRSKCALLCSLADTLDSVGYSRGACVRHEELHGNFVGCLGICKRVPDVAPAIVCCCVFLCE